MADPTLYLYTSLTAGSSHIITATSRLETILKANKIPFRALDCATDEKARTLWSRRSRGRKLPGLVKFGQVIGDHEQVEEWNEFGELHDQIDSADDFLDDSAAPVNPNAISLRPEPGPGVANTLTPIQPAPGRKADQAAISNASSRASSESRHISISEPSGRDREAKSPLATPSENPMTLTMRQLGAEAAAKAKDVQRKTSTTGTKAAPTSSPSQTTPATPASPIAAKEREASDPSQDPDVTAAKTPAQLAAEGARRTSTDKIESKTGTASKSPTSARATAAEVNEDESEPAETTTTKSTEEQVLDLRRQSTQVEQPSRLHESVSAEPDDAGKSEDTSPSSPKEADVAEGANAADDVEPPVTEAATDSKDIAVPLQEHQTTTEPKKEPETEPEKEPKKEAPEAKFEEPTSGPTQSTAETVPFKQPFSDSDKPAIPIITDDDKSIPPTKPRSHRGSSLEEADIAEIRRIEEQNKIEEEDEEDEAAVIDDDRPPGGKDSQDAPAKAVKTSDTAVEPAPEETATTVPPRDDAAKDPIEKPQETAAKDPTAAAKSVED